MCIWDNKPTWLLSFLSFLVTMIQEQASVEDGGFDKGSSGNVAGLAGIQAIMQSISSLNGKCIIRFVFCKHAQTLIRIINSCISTNFKINWYLTGPDSSALEATSGVNGKDPTSDYGVAYATYDENNYVSIFLRI